MSSLETIGYRDFVVNGYNKTTHDHIVNNIRSLGLKRNDLPQIPDNSSKFVKYLQKIGVLVKYTQDYPIHNIKLSQQNINFDKMSSFVREKNFNYLENTDYHYFIISRDNYLLDGHHRLLADLYYGETKVNVIMVMADIYDLIDYGWQYTELKEDAPANNTTGVTMPDSGLGLLRRDKKDDNQITL